MDDLISREQAIDAFRKELTVGESKGNYVTICSAVSYEGAKHILESLPSTQSEIIRCKDCVCWDTSWKPTRAIEGAYWCSNNDIYTESDDYCSLGERKEDG